MIQLPQVEKMFLRDSFMIQMLATLLISFVDSVKAVIICPTVVVDVDQ